MEIDELQLLLTSALKNLIGKNLIVLVIIIGMLYGSIRVNTWNENRNTKCPFLICGMVIRCRFLFDGKL